MLTIPSFFFLAFLLSLSKTRISNATNHEPRTQNTPSPSSSKSHEYGKLPQTHGRLLPTPHITPRTVLRSHSRCFTFTITLTLPHIYDHADAPTHVTPCYAHPPTHADASSHLCSLRSGNLHDSDGEPTYMNSLMMSMSLVLDEFYKTLRVRFFFFFLSFGLGVLFVGVSRSSLGVTYSFVGSRFFLGIWGSKARSVEAYPLSPVRTTFTSLVGYLPVGRFLTVRYSPFPG